MGFIFPRGKFSRRRPYREKRENYPHAKISTFTVYYHYKAIYMYHFSQSSRVRFLFEIPLVIYSIKFGNLTDFYTCFIVTRVDGLIFVGYQFSWFSRRVGSTKSSTRGVTIQKNRIAIYCNIFSLYCDILRYIPFLIFSVKLSLISQYSS